MRNLTYQGRCKVQTLWKWDHLAHCREIMFTKSVCPSMKTLGVERGASKFQSFHFYPSLSHGLSKYKNSQACHSTASSQCCVQRIGCMQSKLKAYKTCPHGLVSCDLQLSVWFWYDFGFFLLTHVLHYPWALSSCLFCLHFRPLLMDTVV
jgi:hypothetical protein